MKIGLTQRKTLKRAIDTYGSDMQRLIVIEELSELQKAVIKQIRKPCLENVRNIAEEIADENISRYATRGYYQDCRGTGAGKAVQ